jgi:hypothetical protein
MRRLPEILSIVPVLQRMHEVVATTFLLSFIHWRNSWRMGDVDKLIGEVDMGLELGGLKKPENFSRAAVVSSKPSPSGGAQPSKDFSSFEVGQMENGF